MPPVRRRDQRQARARTRAFRREAVEKTEAYLRTHAGAAIPIGELCRIVGLSERSLRNAFYDVHGMGPKRCLQDRRLQDARRAQRNAVPNRTTVTEVAAEHGFFELGRFARAYRELFGETPSATLREAISHPPLEDAARGSENINVCRP